MPFTGNNYIFQFIDNVSWISGNHSMKMGAEIRRDHYNMIGTQEIRGSLIIDRPVTGYGFADYMLGMLSRTASAGALGEGWYRATSQAYFFQDTWRVRPSITLDLGLRYEYTPPWLDLKGEQMNMWIPPGFGTPSQQGKPCFIRIGSGDPYEGVSTRFDPGICVARDGRMGDRLVQARQDQLCAAHRRGVEPDAEDDGADRLRDFLRAGYDQSRLRHEPQHPGANHQRRAQALTLRSRTPAVRQTLAVSRCRRRCVSGAAGATQTNTTGARPTSNSTC